MGLDAVEIVMRTEETFGIEIPDKVAARILTPAALIDFVAANVPLKPTDECLSQQLFYRLRRGFRSQLKALSSRFDLDTPLKELLHKDQWAQVWEAVRREVGQPGWPASIPWPGLLSGGPKTVRELIWHVAAALPKPDIAAGEAWTRPRTHAEIRRIVGEQVGAWDYSLKARFVDDIGVS
jgi:acyl carrier protein